MADLRYDNQVVVITGAGSGLGRAYAMFFASRGAKVVVNDLGGSFNGGGKGGSTKVADQVVELIKQRGFTAVANYDSVQHGEKIIETAIKHFGRIDVLINNAGILRDITLRNMTDEDWDIIMDVHLHGPFQTTRAAWPHFERQKYGRVLNTSSAAGLFGNFGQSNYAAAKLALVGFTKTLANEGAKSNIHANVLAPGAASRLTETVWTPEIMEAMSPGWVVPLVACLMHPECRENGGVFEAGGGHFSKLRWERSNGLFLKSDELLRPETLLARYGNLRDFNRADHPVQAPTVRNSLESRYNPSHNDSLAAVTTLDLDGKVALVTGAGDGLGEACALQLARIGANVVVSDVKHAAAVAAKIRKEGGIATALDLSDLEGEALLGAVLKAYGRIDIVVNNAGIVRDAAFANMTVEEWQQVVTLHLRCTYKVTKAVFPFMMKQRSGRVVNITSTSGIYGNIGQANFAAAKAGIIGFTKATAREGNKYNIFVNAVAPIAYEIMSGEMSKEEKIKAIDPSSVAPLIAVLSCERCPANGAIFEAGGGWFAATRWQRARGVDFEISDGVPSVEAVAKAFPKICHFDEEADWPETLSDGTKYTLGNVFKAGKGSLASEPDGAETFKTKIEAVINAKPSPSSYSYTDRDVILYNIGIGAKRTQTSLVYEGAEDFHPLPTFGVVPIYYLCLPWTYSDIVPKYDPRNLLHGEQYLEILRWPLPTSGNLETSTKLIEVVDKGNAALVRRGSTTVDASGKPLFYNESLLFIRGSDGFGGQKKPSNRGAATAANDPPARAPDKVIEEKTHADQAAIYRLMGDRNPLHIDPAFAIKGGFAAPILHGLATFGIVGKHVFEHYGLYKSLKVRFAGIVLPGETIVTELWKEGAKVIFRGKVKETGRLCISNAAAEFLDEQAHL